MQKYKILLHIYTLYICVLMQYENISFDAQCFT
jgi:hypothetical protein